jgi:hypothetical protein
MGPVLSKVVMWFMCVVLRMRVVMGWSLLVEPLQACLRVPRPVTRPSGYRLKWAGSHPRSRRRSR